MKQTVLITGATSGIGELITREFHCSEFDYILVGRNKEKLAALQNDLGRVYNKVTIHECDFSKKNELKYFAKEFAGQASIIINSAADFGPTKNILEVSSNEILQAFNINVLAPIVLTKASLPSMIKKGFGRIINIGSTGGLTGYSLRTPYCLSKSALVAFTKTFNAEVASGEYGQNLDIRSYCLCPGPIKGDRLNKQIAARASYKDQSVEKMAEKFTAISGRVIDPYEVFKKVIELSSPYTQFDGKEIITF